MQAHQNIDLVKRLYEAFGKGDIDTIVNHLADQFVWRFDAPPIIPFAGNYTTPDEVRGYLGHLLEAQKDQVMQTDEFIANEDTVVMVGRYAATVIATNKRVDVAAIHVFTIQAGKLTRFLCFADTAKIADAYQTA
jgi:ketosteroid isomerase-like protein